MENDKEEMSIYASNAEYENIDGIDCWYEWVLFNEKRYQLVYYFEGDQYKAEILEGLEEFEQHKEDEMISSDGIINLRIFNNSPCSKAIEARVRALEILQSIGEFTTMTEQRMRIMTLGFSNAGKTAFIGSLGRLAYGDLRFSLQTEQYISADEITKLYRILSGTKKDSVIPSTTKIRSHEVVLNQGARPILKIGITDIEGQALEQDRNKDVAEQIVQQIGKYNGLILIIEAPKTARESDEKKFELSRMLLFASEVLKRNKSIPMTLILTKIDELPNAKEVLPQLNEELETFENTLRQKYKNNFKEIKLQRTIQKGLIVNKHIEKIINTENIFNVYDTFFNFIRSTDMDIPNKVFPVTSLGFNYISENFNSIGESQKNENIYDPYGSAASFLWTIYAQLLSQKAENIPGLSEGISLERFQNDLLDDIRVLHTSGKAFYSANEDNQNGVWDIRNISNIRTDQIDY